MRNRTLLIDIAQRKFKALSYKQYDSNNELDIVVYENKVLADISNYIAKVYFELPSGKNYVIDGTIKNNTIHTLIPKLVLSEHGQVTVECELRSFDTIITSFAFYFNVEKSIDKDGVQNPNVEHTHENKDTLDRITDNMVDMMELNMGTVNLDSYQLKRDVELDTDDKTIVGAINELNEKIENVDFSGNTNVNLEEYAKKTEIPTKTSQLTNDSNFLTSVPSQYITESELNTALSNYAKKSEVPQQPNFTFKINMVSEGQEATVVTSGTYPNMTFTFNIPQGMSSGEEIVTYSIINNLTKVTTNNNATTIEEGSSYTAKLTPNSNHVLNTPIIKMGGVDVTSSCYSNGTITINNVTGNIEITCVATEKTKYTVTNNLTNVKTNNNATTVYENNSYSSTLTPNNGYELDTITVTMGGKDITNSSYNNGKIIISKVTGNIVIICKAIESVQITEKMWIGYLPYDPDGVVGIDSLDVIGAGLTKKYIDGAVQGGTLKEVSVSTYGKTSVGLAPESSYVCCIYPASKNYTVKIDNGIGGKDLMAENYGDYPVNGVLLNELVDGVQYEVSGFLASMEAERFLYVDQKKG